MKLILLGPPGSGKGTQGKILAQRLAVPQLSTGDMLRSAVAAQSEIGIKAKSIIEAGGLVDDEIVNAIVFDRLSESDCSKGYILDGYPRTVVQAEALDKLLQSRDQRIDKVIELVVDSEALIKRMQQRVEQTKLAGGEIRSDDNVESFVNRIAEYQQKTAPLSGYYEQKGLLVKINGLQDIEEVTSQITAVLAHGDMGEIFC